MPRCLLRSLLLTIQPETKSESIVIHVNFIIAEPVVGTLIQRDATRSMYKAKITGDIRSNTGQYGESTTKSERFLNDIIQPLVTHIGPTPALTANLAERIKEGGIE
ncbi:hypothetical protein BT96DRAFT_950412 [Gymnopus androsaceus JB14]|uniref:Uncharacterized protein n=1 Tax=Gymnopus androsaceus JB14 TaxID=1447944 RepID=A0A6A4GGB7_9AGAR|nr:hypothetical protein BT96DRAFT_950412 [Gymnopus androsaceus JB14]